MIYYIIKKTTKEEKVTTTIGVRDISRNMTSLQDYDYINIEDKKTKEFKGLLVSSKYADEIREYRKTTKRHKETISELKEELKRLKQQLNKEEIKKI